MRSWIGVHAGLSGLILSPNHGKARRMIKAATASTTASMRAVAPMKPHDPIGGIHGMSQTGAEAFQDASSAPHPNQEAKHLTRSGPIASGSNRMPALRSTHSMNSPSVKKKKAPRHSGKRDWKTSPMSPNRIMRAMKSAAYSLRL